MARPTKQTVEYFPHFVTSSKTKDILQDKYGNDGYSFWFKLLELLCRTDGHYYDCREETDWEYFLAYQKVSEEMARTILNKLAEMNNIDRLLWSNRIIWCQQLVDNLSSVYSKRTVSAPKKPVIDEFPNRNPPDNGVIGTDNPQSKVKESKVKESIFPPLPPEGDEQAGQINNPPKRTPRKKAELTKEQEKSFKQFWDIWPHKVSRGQAEITWVKLNPSEEFLEVILAGVKRAIKHDHRFRPGGYMPHPSTWLNAKGWLDEFTGDGSNAGNRSNTEQPGFVPSSGFRNKPK
ncbi:MULTISPECIES: Lin1244/Lin1753 domain-containing protein [unclassified Dehalobacter]|uniref:Lin1244/Lin1753 domain-containing protein n=1 Tax=unclassified Dehalobacter TaxID=2635733 RepID=UPI0014049B80|nr:MULTISPECIES: Lin1244/Lin1753 domain-containing protein [unclassified Dehalobacter]